jgi:hypothetical protein
VQGEHSHSRQLGSGRDGSGHSVWDVVEFQIKENTGGKAGECFHCCRPFGSKEPAPYFHKSKTAMKLSGEDPGRAEPVEVKGQNQSMR